MRREDFDAAVAKHARRVFTLAAYLLGDREEAEDVTQEVLIRLWRRGHEVDPERIGPWLLRVTRNAAIDTILREIQGLSYREIGEALEMPLNSVRVTLHRGRRRLREELSELPELDPPDRVMEVVRGETAPTIGERARGLLDAIFARPAPAVAAIAAIAVLMLAIVPLRQSETPPRYSVEEVERAAEETKLALAYVGGIARYAERQARQKVLSDDAVSGTLREIARSIEWTGAAVSSAPATTKLPTRIDEGSS